MRSRSIAIAVLVALCAFVLSGCTGGGSTTIPKSPFAGTFKGSFTDPVNNQSGTINMTIAGDGTTIGTITNTTTNATGSVTGTVASSGTVSLEFIYATTSYSVTGAVSTDSSGRLVGNLNEYNGNTQVGTLSITLTKQ